MTKHGSIITNAGDTLINEHVLDGNKPFIAENWYMAVGTGDIELRKELTSLVNPIFDKNSDGYNGIVFGTDPEYGRFAEITIPPSLDGNIIKEVGLFNENDDLIAVSSTHIDLTDTINDGIINVFKAQISLKNVPNDILILYTPHGDLITNQILQSELDAFVKKDGTVPFENEQLGVNAVSLLGLPTLLQVKELIDKKDFLSNFAMNSGNKTNGLADILYIQGIGTVTEIEGMPTFTSQTELVAGIDGIKQLSGDTNGTFKIYGRPFEQNANYAGVGAGAGIVDVVDLGELKKLKSFYYFGYNKSGVSSVRLRTLEVSVDKVNWVTIHSGDISIINQEIIDTTKYRFLRISLKNINTGATARMSAFNVFFEETVSVSSATTAYAKVGGSYGNLIATTAKGETYTLSSVTGVNCSSLSSGIYNICLNPATSKLVAVKTVYKQPTRPTMISGDLWLDTSQEKEYAYYYNGSSDILVDYIPVGTATVSGGVITAVTTNNFNDKKVTVPNHTRPAVVVETYQNGTSWYRIWSDGFIEQGGRLTSASTTPVTITFYKAFKNTNYTIFKMLGTNDATSTYARYIGFWNLTTSGATTFSTASYENQIWEARGY